MQLLMLIGSTTAAAVVAVGASQQPVQRFRPITMTGCVQATGDPAEFLLTVPAEFPDAVRGIAKGEAVPGNADVDPAPRPDPQTVPPRDTAPEPGLPEGRYATPTIVNHSYKLVNLDPARLKALVGKGVKVSGEIPVEGYPTGDAPVAGQDARALVSVLNPPFRAKTIQQVADSCAALIRSK